ncbi:hypothetical protein ACIP2X_04680 [Streptomyces sp. NPDC089424]|uniref:hypothetical protein n=1 Tax=Streptomyces sp. NPDC089424 TaxID=3365917 RepID=UPI0037FB91E1
MQQRTGQDVLRDVVSSLAPGELEKLDPTCRAYAARPYPPQPLHRSAGDPLGIGVETAVLLPVLVAVVSQILADLASGHIRAGGTRITRWWRRRQNREAAEGRRAALTSPVPELSDVTRQELTDWALVQGRAAGLSAAEADECARIVVMAVVVRSTTPSPSPSPDGAASGGAASGTAASDTSGRRGPVGEDPGSAQAPATTPPS